MKYNKSNIAEMKKILSNESYNYLISLSDKVANTKTDVDDKVLSEMLMLLKKYNSVQFNDYFKYIPIYELINKYVKIISTLITNIPSDNIENYRYLLDYLNFFTDENIKYKISIINEFKKYDLEMIHDFDFENPFKKFLQVLSCAFRKDRNVNPKYIYEKSNSFNIQQKGKKICELILELNKKAELLNQKLLVKPTVSTMEACFKLTDIVTDNENQFKDLVNHLYKLFWENKEFKKYAINGELDFVNDLRRYFFHDLDHGNDYEKKVKRVGEIYKIACGKRVPENSKDWQKVQTYIYELLINFLENIHIC